jgi:F-type H+-transporting ATPase subunit gamma
MAKARALDKRRKSIRNIRKITRTMELIATARFKKAMDRATAASAYTKRITQLVADLTKAGAEVDHPLLKGREKTKAAQLLVLTANRGLCGGYNGSVIRQAVPRLTELQSLAEKVDLEVAGKRGIANFKFRKIAMSRTYTQFEDQPKFAEIDELATRYLEAYAAGELDRLDVVYTKFVSSSKQVAVVETLLPMGSLELPVKGIPAKEDKANAGPGREDLGVKYDFIPSADAILKEVVPTSFKIRLFKCFLDAAVSEQIARMVAMKAATENASEMIHQLSRDYNRARQSQITGEIMEIIGGVEAIKG